MKQGPPSKPLLKRSDLGSSSEGERPVWGGGRRQPPSEPMPELGMRMRGDDGCLAKWCCRVCNGGDVVDSAVAMLVVLVVIVVVVVVVVVGTLK